MKQGSIMAAFGKSKAKKIDSSDEDSPVKKKKSTVITDRKVVFLTAWICLFLSFLGKF